MKEHKTALVIGAQGGLGREVVLSLLKKGWYVFAADLESHSGDEISQFDHVMHLRIDITNQESIEQAYELIRNKTDILDAIIHMAGVLKIGSLLEVPVADLQTALDINLHGVVRVNKQFLPLLLSGKGRIIILSSEVARQTAAPFNGIYAISKHALEAYADALRRELNFLGIKVIKIQPGPFKTSMTRSADQLFQKAEQSSVYFKKNIRAGMAYLPKVYKNAQDPVYVARTIMRALETRKPKTAYPVKRDLPRRILDWLPTKWADWLIKKMLS